MNHPNQYIGGWSQEELHWLKTQYPHLTKEEVVEWAKKHGRTYKAVINQASCLGIKKIRLNRNIDETLLQKKIQTANSFPKINRFIKLSETKLVKIVIAGDSHYPFNNPKAEKELFNFLRDEKPNFFIHIGDLIDFHEISYFRRVPNVPYSLKEELEMAKWFFSMVRSILPKSQIYYIEGNHEFRWRKYLIEYATVFYEFFSFKLPDLMQLKERKVIYIPLKSQANKFSHNFIRINDVYIGHFDKTLQNAGYTARWLRDTFASNIITGHTHRLALTYKTYFKDIKFGAEAGCLCDTEPSFISSPDWQNGWLELIWEKGKIRPILYPLDLIGEWG